MSASEDTNRETRPNLKETARADASIDDAGTGGRRKGVSEGGEIAIRGFLIQALGGIQASLIPQPNSRRWTEMTFEPRLVDSDKVDILWVYDDDSRMAEQVKSTIRPFRPREVRQWANELKKWKYSEGATRYQLTLAGPNAAELEDEFPDVMVRANQLRRAT